MPENEEPPGSSYGKPTPSSEYRCREGNSGDDRARFEISDLRRIYRGNAAGDRFSNPCREDSSEVCGPTHRSALDCWSPAVQFPTAIWGATLSIRSHRVFRGRLAFLPGE